MGKLFIDDMPDTFFKGKRVVLRVDFNVPIKRGHIKEDYRIRQTIPTIEYLSKKGARTIIISHLGRPAGVADTKLSLKPVAERLIEILNVPDVQFVDECAGKHVNYLVDRLGDGEVLLLENIRFHKEEEQNDPEFCNFFSSLADIYVNDAFSSCHRAHASTYGIPKLFEYRLGGFLIKNEINNLDLLRFSPQRPMLVIVGGAKVKEKLEAIKHLKDYADKILVGGCVANTFLSAQGVSIGDSLVINDCIPVAKNLLQTHGDKIFLPDDFIVHDIDSKKNNSKAQYSVTVGNKIMDIGRDTTYYFSQQVLNNKGTILWSGPMGSCELNEYSYGTAEIAKSMSYAHWRGAFTAVGGDDTIEAIRKADVLLNEIDFVSTGGSATLQYLGGGELPAISVLSDNPSAKENQNNPAFRGESACL